MLIKNLSLTEDYPINYKTFCHRLRREISLENAVGIALGTFKSEKESDFNTDSLLLNKKQCKSSIEYKGKVYQSKRLGRGILFKSDYFNSSIKAWLEFRGCIRNRSYK